MKPDKAHLSSLRRTENGIGLNTARNDTGISNQGALFGVQVQNRGMHRRGACVGVHSYEAGMFGLCLPRGLPWAHPLLGYPVGGRGPGPCLHVCIHVRGIQQGSSVNESAALSVLKGKVSLMCIKGITSRQPQNCFLGDTGPRLPTRDLLVYD